MTAQVHSILEKSPHMRGPAKCLACQHEWVAVSPLGVAAIECPGCGLNRGVFAGPPETQDAVTFVCNCGCAMFKVLPGLRAHCLYCGFLHDMYEIDGPAPLGAG